MSVSELSLERLATPKGVFCMLALDHRDALRNTFRRAGVADVSTEVMIELKCRIVRALGAHASALLLDPDAALRCRPLETALLVPLEEQGHEPLDGGRLNRLALLGGSEVDGETFAAQLETACRAGASGFIAGRAVWSGALGLAEPEQEQWLAREAAPLFEQLTAIADLHGRPLAAV